MRDPMNFKHYIVAVLPFILPVVQQADAGVLYSAILVHRRISQTTLPAPAPRPLVPCAPSFSTGAFATGAD